MSCIYQCRYITRTVLIPFDEGAPVPAASRVIADQKLRTVMKSQAGKAASLMVAVGGYLVCRNASYMFRKIITHVESLLPDNCCHRLLVSYSWLLLATFKVCC